MTVHYPRGYAEISGSRFVPVTMDITLTTTASSDTFSLSVPIRSPGFNLAPLLKDGKVEIKLYSPVGKLFTGLVDNVDVDFSQGHVSIRGRDKSAGLIDNKANASHKNKKPDEVAKELAAKRGLKFKSDGGGDGGGEKAGKQFNTDFALLSDHISEWTLIQNLAEREGKVAYVSDDTLHFVNPNEEKGVAFAVRYQPPTPMSHADGNFITLRVSRNVNLGKTNKVKVKSWHPKKKKSVSVTKQMKGSGGENSYEYRDAQLNYKQAEKMADKRLKENSSHEFDVTVDAPGQIVDPRGRLSVTGTGTVIDHTYEINSVHHQIGQGSGWRMTIRSKNAGKGRKAGGKAGK